MSNQGWLPVRPRAGALAASAFDPPEGGGGGGTVTPPAATTEALPDTDTPTAKTFSAFTDAEGLIDNYLSEIVDIEGTTTASGSGLGPYTYSGAGPGSAFMQLLHARDADNNILATAAHGVDIMPSPPSAVTPPAATFEAVATGGTPANKTFGAFTDPDGLIDNYVSTVVDISGTATATGTGLGAYSYSGTANGSAFVQTLTARDASNNPLATAVHGVQVAAAASGALGWETLADYDLTTIDTAAADTATTGDIALTVSSAAFVSLVDRTGSGTGSITPTNGTGVVVETVGAGSRSMAITHDWAGDGVDPTLTPVAIEAEYTISVSSTGTNIIVGAASAGSSALTGNVNMCLRAEDAGVNIELAPRVYTGSAVNDTVGLASASITTLSVSVLRLPEGIEIGYSLGALPADPRAHTYRRSWAKSQGFAAAPSDFALTDAVRAIFHVFNAAGTAVWTRARFRSLGVV